MKVLITAGPTREAIDPVRYLSNRSSGKMGYALASAALDAGHQVILISGPVTLQPPAGESVTVHQVESAEDMFQAVAKNITDCDIAIFAAAVADYRPIQPADHKIKKTSPSLTLELEKTKDILGSARSVFGFQGYLVGFAAETEHLETHALEKARRKHCDLIIANDVSRKDIGFDSNDNAVSLVSASGEIRHLPKQSKSTLAAALFAFILNQY